MLGAALVAFAHADAPKTNIIFILTDDFGWGDIGVFYQNSRNFAVNRTAPAFVTPNIDRLAATGTKFINAYSMPQCAPSRLCLLTGQYPFRNGWVNHWDTPRWGVGYYDWKTNPSLGRVM